MTNENMNKLSHLISQHLELQTELLELEKNKTEILIKGDIEQLNQVMVKEQSYISKSDCLEKQCQELLADAGLSGLSFREISEQNDPDSKYLFSRSLTALADVLHQLKKTNDFNNKIILSRISVLEQCLSMLGLREDSLTYKKDGHF